jgi:hypothetical protein
MPELSIVMSAHNDNYGGEVYREGPEPAVPTPQKDRMRLSFKTLHEAFKNIDYEVVFVEWNPVEGKEKISDWDFMKHSRVRIIEVPKDISDKVLRGQKEFHEMHAKNVGIRRSKSPMVLGTNPDVLWIHPMPREILGLHDGVTISWRWTVYHQVLDYVDNLYTIVGFCLDSNNCIDHDLNSNGDFTMMSRDAWFALKGYSTPNDLSMVAGLDIQTARRGRDFTGKMHVLPFPVWHVRHPGKALKSCNQDIIEVSDDWGFPRYEFKEF